MVRINSRVDRNQVASANRVMAGAQQLARCVEEMETRFKQTTKASATENLQIRFFKFFGHRKLTVCFGFICVFLLVLTVGMSFLIIKVDNLSDNKDHIKDTPSSDALVLDSKMDVPGGQQSMSDSQKFFLNIGLRQDHLIQDCVENQLKKSFPNIDYVFFGYDIYRGYPLAESHDPGFTQPIFRADYSQKRQSADCRFSLPNGVIAVPDVSCVTSFSSETIRTTEQLQKALAVSADVSGGGYGVKFSASAGYKKATSSIKNGESVLVISTARCDYYFVKLRKEFAPTFDDEFLIWISKLDKSEDNTTYIEFMNKFGTHYLTGATFGARFTYEHKLSQSYYEQTQATEFNVAVRASYSGSFSVGGGFSLDQSQREAASDFSRKVETRTITVGAAPPSNGDALTWASTVQNNPIPTKYTLAPIEDLFIEDVANLGIDYETIRSNLIKYKEDYVKYRQTVAESFNYNPASSLPSRGAWLTNKKTLLVLDGGIQGYWGEWEFCPPGEYAVGYNLQIEPYQGSGDDTSLNTIRLVCANQFGEQSGVHITSKQGFWGNYKPYDAVCPRHGDIATFLNRFSLQVYDKVSIAATFVNFECQDLKNVRGAIELHLPPGYEESFGGEWYSSSTCPVNSAICGIKTKVEDRQKKGDDSALNDVRFKCCGY